MNTHNHLPDTVSARLDARLAPFGRAEVSQVPAPEAGQPGGLSLFSDLKLLFAALGAGGSVVPLGDNSRATRLLAQYAASLRDR